MEQEKKIAAIEELIRNEEHGTSANFVAKVMEQVEEVELSFLRRFIMEIAKNSRIIASSFATLAIVVVVLRVASNTPVEIVSGSIPYDISKRFEELEKKPSGPAPVIAKEVKSKEAYLDIEKRRGEPTSVVPPSKPETATVAREKSAVGSAFMAGALAPQPFQQQYGAQYQDFWTPPPSYQNTEQYIGYTENPRVLVTDEAISTFSIDVDTGSYTNARRFLTSGQLPPPDSVRIEEFLNYFDYNYPVQHEKPFTLSYEIAPGPLDHGRYLLKLGIKARDAAVSEKPWNLVFLIDVSGSMMTPDKIELIKRSLPMLVERMRPADRIAIVTYAGNAGLVLDSTTINEKGRILSAIQSLQAGGSTNGSAGINLAYQVAEAHKITGGVNRVILTTDGDFNVGVTSHEELVRLIEEKRRSGITLTTLGFGTGNLKDGTMEQLANKGNGNYFYVDSFKEARKVLETNLVGNMEVVAKDVKLQIEFNPAHVSEYRLIGYENRKLQKQDFNNDQIDAGEIGVGHTVTALYEVVLADTDLAKNLESEYRYQKHAPKRKVELAQDKGSELAFLKIRFKEPEGSTSTLLQFPIEAKDVRRSVSEASDDFKFAAAVSYFGHLLRGSQFKGDYGFNEVANLAASARGEDKFGYRQELVELIKNAAAVRR